MSSPPFTGNDDLDAFLYKLQLDTVDSGTTGDTTIDTGVVNADYYPEQYIQVRYALSETGASLSTSPTNKTYYGVYNSITTTASNNPADYTWKKLTDTLGFSTDKFLFYTVLRGRNIKFYIGDSAPTVYWAVFPTTYVDLDIISEGFIDDTDFSTGYEPVAIVNGLPNAATYTGPNIVYDTVTNKMYRWYNGQWYSNVLAADIEGALAYANFSNSLRPVEVVSTLPSSGNFVGRVVLLISDGKIYRYTATGWTAAVPTVDLTGTITSAQIADGSIAGTKFASGLEPVTLVTSVPSVKSTSTIFNSTDGKLYRWNGTSYIATVPTVDITGQMTNAQIADLAATKITGQMTNAQLADLAATKITGQLTNAQLADLAATKITGQIVETQITDNAITSNKIIANAIIAGKIAADAVTANTIAADSITSTKIFAGAITTAKLAANAVTANEIAANAITSDKITANAIIAGKIAADAVTANEIAANSITTAKIAANAITANEIATNAITSDKIIANAITTGKIQAAAITANEIAANGVTADKIASNAVTTIKLDALAITSEKIAANAITAGKIAVDAVTAGVISAGAITSDKLAANSVIAGKIAAGAVSASNISTTNLSSINSNLGAITGGSINIANKFIVDGAGNTTIQSGTSGARTLITNEVIKVYDASGVLRIHIGNLSA